MKTVNKATIKCPCCGYEFLPGEIFMPNNFLGQPKHIVRDALGKILYEEYLEGKELDLTETYNCDNCGTQFTVECTMSFKSKVEDDETNFSSEYSSLI